MSLIQLFQIGDVPLYGYAAINPEPDWQPVGKTQTAVQSPTVFRPYSRFITKPRKIRTDVTLYNDEFRSKQDLIQHLHNIAGVDTDIIVFEPLSTAVEFSRDRYNNFYSPDSKLLWLHTRGQIKDINTRINDRQVDLRLDLELDAYYQPLNHMLFQIIDAVSSHHYIEPQTISQPYQPSVPITPSRLNRIFKRRPEMFHKIIMENWGDQFEPEWYEALLKAPPNLPRLGFNTSWDTTENKVIDIYIDKFDWGMPPIVKYIFKNIPSTGTITITVERENEIWYTETFTSTIDLSKVDEAVTTSGHTITTTDKLILGDTHWMPGYVLRGNNRLTQIGDAVTRDANGWVGQLLPGKNRITIQVPEGVEFFVAGINRKA